MSSSPGVASVSRVRAPGAMQLLTTSYRDSSFAAIWLKRCDPRLRGAVVRLAGIREEPRGTRGVHEVAALAATRLVLAPPVHRSVTSRREMPLEVNGDDVVPFGLGHVHDRAVAQDPRIVDHHVEAAVGVDRRSDETLRSGPVCDVVGVRDRLAAGVADLADHVICRRFPRGGTVVRATVVVDDDPWPPRRRRTGRAHGRDRGLRR